MKRVILSIFTVAITPVALLFALIFVLASYHSNYVAKIIALNNFNKVAYAALPPSSLTNFNATIDVQDSSEEIVRQFFEKYRSPLEPYAQDVIEAANLYGIDYRLVPAIAMQESNLCLKAPEGSNNCWGYGIYGGKVHKFDTYKDGIYAVSKTLGTDYKNRGLITPDEIMSMWTPSSNGSWAFSVNHFMGVLK